MKTTTLELLIYKNYNIVFNHVEQSLINKNIQVTYCTLKIRITKAMT